MSQLIKFYMDEHVSRAIVDGLRRQEVDVLTVGEAGMLGAKDEAHLQLAIRLERVIFTQDSDFLRFHALGVPHRGIVYAPQGTPIGKIIRGLLLVHEVLTPTDMENHVEYL